jgi:hypothetical protein
MFLRIFTTIAVIALYTLFQGLWSPYATLLLGQHAGDQFLSSDMAFLSNSYWTLAIQTFTTFSWVVLAAILVLLWWGPTMRAVDTFRKGFDGGFDRTPKLVIGGFLIGMSVSLMNRLSSFRTWATTRPLKPSSCRSNT